MSGHNNNRSRHDRRPSLEESSRGDTGTSPQNERSSSTIDPSQRQGQSGASRPSIARLICPNPEPARPIFRRAQPTTSDTDGYDLSRLGGTTRTERDAQAYQSAVRDLDRRHGGRGLDDLTESSSRRILSSAHPTAPSALDRTNRTSTADDFAHPSSRRLPSSAQPTPPTALNRHDRRSTSDDLTQQFSRRPLSSYQPFSPSARDRHGSESTPIDLTLPSPRRPLSSTHATLPSALNHPSTTGDTDASSGDREIIEAANALMNMRSGTRGRAFHQKAGYRSSSGTTQESISRRNSSGYQDASSSLPSGRSPSPPRRGTNAPLNPPSYGSGFEWYDRISQGRGSSGSGRAPDGSG